MTDALNLLWHSNSPSAPSGYGNQTDVFMRRIQDAGHDLVICAFYGHQGSVVTNQLGIVELPCAPNDMYGSSIIAEHMRVYKRDAVISLIDPHVLKTDVWGALDWTAWAPIDCEPINIDNKQALMAAKDIWAMSRFGERVLKDAGFTNVHYVPHGVETTAYTPIDRDDARGQFEQMLDVDLTDKFLVVTVAANKGTPSRKNFAGMLRAFAEFAKTHDDAMFYLHTDPHGMFHGDHLLTMVDALGLRDKVIFPSNYHYICGMYTPGLMNFIYNAADVFMLLSWGEGFGLPIVEAQAAGCPVIVTDGSAMTELCLSGWLVKSTRIHALNGRFGCDWWLADHDDAVRRLKAAYKCMTNPVLRDDVRKKAREEALAYDADHVFDKYMQPAISSIQARIESAREAQVQSEARMKTIQSERKLKRAKIRANASIEKLEAVAGD